MNDVIERIAGIIDQELVGYKEKYLMCHTITALGYNLLLEHGVETTPCFGSVAYGINKTECGIVTFGRDEQISYVGKGHNLNGHYWLEYKRQIIDFSLPYLPLAIERIDKMSGQLSGAINIPLKPLVSKLKMKSFKDIFKGKTGFCYEKKRDAKSDLQKAIDEFKNS
jgi:hypothetical protein